MPMALMTTPGSVTDEVFQHDDRLVAETTGLQMHHIGVLYQMSPSPFITFQIAFLVFMCSFLHFPIRRIFDRNVPIIKNVRNPH